MSSFGIFQINAAVHSASPRTLIDNCSFNASEAAAELNQDFNYWHGDLQKAVQSYNVGLGNVRNGNLVVGSNDANQYWANFQASLAEWGIAT